MIRSISNRESLEPFLQQLAEGEGKAVFELTDALDREGTLAFGSFDGEEMTGLFLFSRWEDKYLVMSRWLTRSETAGREMLTYLNREYPGYGVEFTFRPQDALLKKLLLEAGATVFPEQRDMKLVGPVTAVDTSGIEPLSKALEPRYFVLHRDSNPDGETYWTGEMVAANQARFIVLLALQDGVPVGYLDLGLGEGGSNVGDLYVDPAYRRQGWGRKLLGKAIERNGAKPLTLQVDVDNEPAIRLYENMGFRAVPDSSRIDAIWRIEG